MSAIDTAQVDLMFTELRLPTIKAVWQPLSVAERATPANTEVTPRLPQNSNAEANQSKE